MDTATILEGRVQVLERRLIEEPGGTKLLTHIVYPDGTEQCLSQAVHNTPWNESPESCRLCVAILEEYWRQYGPCNILDTDRKKWRRIRNSLSKPFISAYRSRINQEDLSCNGDL